MKRKGGGGRIPSRYKAVKGKASILGDCACPTNVMKKVLAEESMQELHASANQGLAESKGGWCSQENLFGARKLRAAMACVISKKPIPETEGNNGYYLIRSLAAKGGRIPTTKRPSYPP